MPYLGLQRPELGVAPVPPHDGFEIVRQHRVEVGWRRRRLSSRGDGGNGSSRLLLQGPRRIQTRRHAAPERLSMRRTPLRCIHRSEKSGARPRAWRAYTRDSQGLLEVIGEFLEIGCRPGEHLLGSATLRPKWRRRRAPSSTMLQPNALARVWGTREHAWLEFGSANG